MSEKTVTFSSIWMIGLLILAMAGKRASGETGMKCSEAVTRLMPCRAFLAGTINVMPTPCCRAAVSLNHELGTDPGEMNGLCDCFRKTAASIGAIADRAKKLPNLCSIIVPSPIDPNGDCGLP